MISRRLVGLQLALTWQMPSVFQHWPEQSDRRSGISLLTHNFLYNTLCRMGRAVKEMLNYFNWKRFAMFYTDDRGTRKCFSIAEGMRKVFANVDIINVYNLMINSATASATDIEIFLKALPELARSKIKSVSKLHAQ